jgi:rhodanese-related sulfurtransferase
MWPFVKRPEGAGSPVEVPVVDVKTAFARSRRGAKLVDVRSSREFAHVAHAKGAVSVPPGLIARDRTGLERDDEILVICLSGHRSPRQARKLAAMGFTRVTNVEGGLLAWKRAKLPVRK